MKYKQVIDHFGGSVTQAANALSTPGAKVTKQRVYGWHRQGRIPTRWQIVIAKMTGLSVDAAARKQAMEYAAVLKK